MPWRSFWQKLIVFMAVASLVLVLVLVAGIQVTVALGAAGAVAIVGRDVVGPDGGNSKKINGNRAGSPRRGVANSVVEEEGQE